MPSFAPNTDLLAPRFLLSVEGKGLGEDVTSFVSRVEYEEGENVASKISIDVNNVDFRFLDERVFAEGNELDLWMGYAGKPLRFMNRGFIVAPEPSFPRGGIPNLRVVAVDASFDLMTVPGRDRGKSYSRQTDSDIASAVFRSAGVVPFVYRTKRLQTRTRKKGTNRWEFLRRLAKLHDFVVQVYWDTEQRAWIGYFGPPDAQGQEERRRFVYGTGEADATLLEFSPRTSISSQTTELEVSWTDPKTRKLHRVTVKVRSKEAERTGFNAAIGLERLQEKIPNGPAVTVTTHGQREEAVAGLAFRSTAEAKRWAAAWYSAREREFVSGSGVIVGSPDLRRGQIHDFEGLGPRYSGDWVLRRVVHKQQARSLYEVRFDARKRVLRSVLGSPENTSAVRGEEAEQ